MDLASLHHLGRLGKPWGRRGELTLHLLHTDFGEVLALGVLFAEIDGQRVPFHVSHMRDHPRTGAVVKFEDFDDPQSVAFLVNCEVFAPPGHVPPELEADEEGEEELDPEELVGMHVRDVEHGDLGEMIGTEGTDDNPVMVVQHGDTEILVPMGGDFIEEIDMEARRILLRTPPGLIDVYTNSGASGE